MGRGHQGKIAVVTGGAEGLGRAFALRLAEDGVDVVIADVKLADETVRQITAAGRRGLAVKCNVGDPADVVALASAVEAHFGRCDILVNAAGIAELGTIEDTDYAAFRRTMAINVDGTFLGCKHALGLMKRTGGAIVNISSVSGLIGGHNLAAYNASKGAVRLLSKSVALHGARLNPTPSPRQATTLH